MTLYVRDRRDPRITRRLAALGACILVGDELLIAAALWAL